MKHSIRQWLCLLTCIGFCFPFAVKSSTTQLLLENTIPINSVVDDDFSGLDRFKAQLEADDIRLVFLGEQTHGGATTFEAKIKLIKYLHQNAGFDVLAFESSLFGMGWAEQQIYSGTGSFQALFTNLAEAFSQCDQVFPLFSYFDQTTRVENPLHLVGFDVHYGGNANWLYAADYLQRFLLQYEVENEQHVAMLRNAVNHVIGRYGVPQLSEYEATLELIKKVSDKLGGLNVDSGMLVEQPAFWRQFLRSIASQMEMYWYYGENSHGGQLARERQMAENLAWFANDVFPDKKIVVWAHNIHVAKKMKVQPSIWDLLPKPLKRQSHVVLFTAAEGRFTNYDWQGYTSIRNAEAGSLEQRLLSLPSDYGLLLLSELSGSRWPKDIRSAAIANYLPVQKLNITNRADSIFFIKKEVAAQYSKFPAKPSIPPKLAPAGVQNRKLLGSLSEQPPATVSAGFVFWGGWSFCLLMVVAAVGYLLVKRTSS